MANRIDLVLELDDHALRALATDARYLAQLQQVLGRNRAAQLVRTEYRQRSLRQLGSDSGRSQQELEEFPLISRGEAVQRERVFSNDERRRERCLLSDTKTSYRVGAADRLNAQAANLDDCRCGSDLGDQAGQLGDHASRLDGERDLSKALRCRSAFWAAASTAAFSRAVVPPRHT